MPSQSVEATTRAEAIEAAREEYGPSVKIVGVRRIRSGGVMGFFASERYVAEVDVTAGRADAGRPTEPARRQDGVGRRAAGARTAESVDELADLLRPASGELPIGLYTPSGVSPAPAIEDLVAQQRPRTAPAPASTFGAARGFGAAPAAARSTAGAASTAAAGRGAAAAWPWGSTPAGTAARTPVRTSASTRSPAGARTVAEARAAARTAAAPAEPFAPKRHRPTLDHLVDPGPAPVVDDARAAAVAPSPFTAALARMVADRQVSEAVSDAVERSAEQAVPAPIEPAVLRQPVVEDFFAEPAAAEPVPEPVPEPAAVEPPVAEPVVVEVPVAEEPVAGPMDQRAVLQSALKSVLSAADPSAADPDVERLLEGVLERVLAGDAVPVTAPDLPIGIAAATDDDLFGTGRHRLPEWALGTEEPGSEAAPETDDHSTEEAVTGDLVTDHRFDADLFDADLFDDDLFAADLFAADLFREQVTVERVAFEHVPAAAQMTATDGWVEEVRREDVRVHDIRSRETRSHHPRTQEFRIDVRDNEVLAHREPLVMTPSMAAWPTMARTASDPAPMSLDATTILPPLSLLPPQRMPSVGGRPPLLKGRPAVPPPRRPLNRAPNTASSPVAALPAVPQSTGRSLDHPGLEVTATHRDLRLPLGHAPVPDVGRGLATVTRLVRSASKEMAPFGLTGDDELVVRLLALGLPEFLIAPDFATDAAARGTYAALTRTLAHRLPPLPEVPAEPGDVLLVVGPGPETLAAARTLAVTLRLDPARVQWATPSDSAYLAPEPSRIATLETAVERFEQSRGAGSVTIVAVDAPLRTGGGGWLAQMLSVWSPVAVWGVVDATRKLEDVVPWLDGLPRLDAVVLQETDCTADPAAVLSHVTAPVARVDGARATAHRWASLLCERLDMH